MTNGFYKKLASDGLFGLVDDNLLLKILERTGDTPGDRHAFRLVCRRWLLLEASSRNRLRLFRVEVVEELLRRYRNVRELDLSPCVQETDDTLVTIGEHGGATLRSVNLSSLGGFSDVGLSALATKCPFLRELDLSHCTQIADQGMIALSNLKELETLKLVDCRNVGDVGLGCVAAGCKKLRYLSLRWCLAVTDVGIGLVASNCNELQTLDLSYTEVTARGLQSITQLGSLKNLVLVSCNSVNDAGLECLKQCANHLLRLDVARCINVSERGIMALASGAAPLQQLTLSYCSPTSGETFFRVLPKSLLPNCGCLSDRILKLAKGIWGRKSPKVITEPLLASFGKFESLLSIRLDGCEIAKTGLAFIGRGCKLLREFSVSKCRGVTDEGLQEVVQGCNDLHMLDLTCCRELTDASLTSIASSCRALIILKMEACSLLTDKGFAQLANGCKHLEELDLTDTNINDDGLKSLSRCTALRILKLGYCLNLTHRGVSYIGANCHNLREIDLYRSVGITDSGTAAIANGCAKLRTLNLSYCAEITDNSLQSISQLRDLNHLEIRACRLVTSVGLSFVAQSCKRLLELDVKHCSSINDTGILAIARNCPGLREVNLSYSAVGDEGLEAMANLKCMQNMKLIHVKEVSMEGIENALLSCGSLKKIKLEASLRMRLSQATQRVIDSRGCRLRWMDKDE